jgi:phosphorylated CTD-interacting factor 1
MDNNSVQEYCEANPPFSIGIMKAMADHLNGVLSQAENDNRKLTFVVIVPSAVNASNKFSIGTKVSSVPQEEGNTVVKQAAYRSFQELVSSKYCTKHIQLEARHHGYVEGSQHLRPTMYKTSTYDTSVIILQSPKAKTPSSGLKYLELEIPEAFASRHEKEIDHRKIKA